MGKPMEALDLFDEALEHDASEQDVLILKMFVYFNLGNHAMSLRMIEDLFSKEIEEDRVIMEAHFCLQLMEAYDDGVRILEAYTNIDPYNEAVWYHLGQLNAVSENYTRAIECFDFAAAIDDTYAEPIMEKGQCQMQLDLFNEAIQSFQEYIEMEGADALAYTQIGDCYRLMDQYKRSRLNYQLALKTDPKVAGAWLGLGQSFCAEGRYADALTYLQKANKLYPNDEYTMVELARTLAELGRSEEAEDTLKNVTDFCPTYDEAWLELARIYHELGETYDAIQLLEGALDRVKDKSRVHYRLAAYYLLNGVARNGYEHLTDALLINFDDHPMLFEDAPFLQNVQAVNDIIDLYRK